MAAAFQPLFRPGPVGQPDIEYTPDYNKYLARAKFRQENEKLETNLPPGFPPKLDSELVWDGNDLAESYNWNYQLSVEDLNEIKSALQFFKGCYSVPNSIKSHVADTWFSQH